MANQTDKSIYEEFSKFPERARRFGNAMRSLTMGTGFELDHIVDNFPWEDIKDGTVIDVCPRRNAYHRVRKAAAR